MTRYAVDSPESFMVLMHFINTHGVLEHQGLSGTGFYPKKKGVLVLLPQWLNFKLFLVGFPNKND